MEDVELRGPLFNGHADTIIQGYCDAVAERGAQEGQSLVREYLGSSIQNGTGYYESRVRVESHGQQAEVNDSGVVYGPWLEGTGSRNRTTRFKGYSSFRKASQELEARMPDLAERTLRPYLDRLGG